MGSSKTDAPRHSDVELGELRWLVTTAAQALTEVGSPAAAAVAAMLDDLQDDLKGTLAAFDALYAHRSLDEDGFWGPFDCPAADAAWDVVYAVQDPVFAWELKGAAECWLTLVPFDPVLTLIASGLSVPEALEATEIFHGIGS